MAQVAQLIIMHKKVLLFILFCIIATVVFAWILLNQEPPAIGEKQKKEALENILGRNIREEKNIPQGEKAYPGKYFSLFYPAYAQVYDRENKNIDANKKLLEYFRLDSEQPKFRFMVMVEAQDRSAVLGELSAVKARRQNRIYKEVPLTVDGSIGILFVKTQDGVERSSFFLKNGRSYSFVITGVDESELEKIYGQIMQSLLLK